MIRREWLPAWVAFGVAGTTFLLTFFVVGWIAGNTLLFWYPISETARVVVVATIVVVVPYVIARATYTSLRWERIDDGHLRCGMCEYDLTGNTSGTCPECGREVAADTRNP